MRWCRKKNRRNGRTIRNRRKVTAGASRQCSSWSSSAALSATPGPHAWNCGRSRHKISLLHRPVAAISSSPFGIGDRSMSRLVVRAGEFTFDARFEDQLAPRTCEAFRRAMPFASQMVHVRGGGGGVWLPLGDLDFGVDYENHTSYPAPGQIILYPGGISETEILLAYGGGWFASKMGQIARKQFITLYSRP